MISPEKATKKDSDYESADDMQENPKAMFRDTYSAPRPDAK